MPQIKKYRYPVVLTIAGSDSGGGAGIQADLKTIAALGCYGASAITAVTVQNTLGVTDIHYIPADIVAGQIKAVLDDLRPSAIKIGMMGNASIMEAIADILQNYQQIPIVLDPVMVSTSGRPLIDTNAIGVLRSRLFPLTRLITPNIDEAAALTGMQIVTIEDMKAAADELVKQSYQAVLIKGGHLPGKKLYNFYLDSSGSSALFNSDAVDTDNTHGTGCTLSSAIATYLALNQSLEKSIEQAGIYVNEAIAQGTDVKVGEGKGPLNHSFKPVALSKFAI